MCFACNAAPRSCIASPEAAIGPPAAARHPREGSAPRCRKRRIVFTFARAQARQPGQQAQVHVIVVGTGLAGGARPPPPWPSSATTSLLLLPGQPAPRPLDRRAGRHQRRQELPERRRQHPPPVLRHGQGRRLPRPRGQRLPPGRGVGQHHRPVRRAGRAVRARVRRPAGQPLLRRRPGVAHLLRPRPDRPAAAARRLPGAVAADRAGKVKMFTRTEMLDLVVVDGHARGIVVRDLVTGKIESHSADAVCWPPAATATSSTCRPTPRAATSPRRGAPTSAARLFANPCYTQIHPTCIPVSGDYQSKLTLMSESLRNDGRVWVPKKPKDATSARIRPDPREERDYYLERKYPSFGNLARATSPRAPPSGVRRGPRRRPRRPRACTSTSPTPSSAWASRRSPSVRQPVRDVRAKITGENPTRADAHLPRRALHDGRPVGGLQPDEHDPRPVRARRGQLLRPRRQPPRRLGADAGPGRRLLRDPVHARQLPRGIKRRARSAPTTPSSSARSRPTSRAASTAAEPAPRASAPSTLPQGARPRSCGRSAAWPATPRA
jgi:hypothetical protein